MIYELMILRSFDFIVSWLNTDHIRSLPRSLPTGSRYRCRCGCYSTRSAVIAAVAPVRAPLSSALLPPLPLWSLSHVRSPTTPVAAVAFVRPPLSCALRPPLPLWSLPHAHDDHDLDHDLDRELRPDLDRDLDHTLD